jgi:hypothetical protein
MKKKWPRWDNFVLIPISVQNFINPELEKFIILNMIIFVSLKFKRLGGKL